MNRWQTSEAWNKVPEIALSFWIVKIMSTTVGETGADFLAVNAGWGQAATQAVMAALLAAALFAQLRSRRYIPSIYWLTVVLVSVVGTQITDLLTDGLGVSLYISTAAFALLLAAVFFVWYRLERTLSIQSIVTRRRELFYWAAILCTFALGTAAGDLATEALGLGFTWGPWCSARCSASHTPPGVSVATPCSRSGSHTSSPDPSVQHLATCSHKRKPTAVSAWGLCGRAPCS